MSLNTHLLRWEALKFMDCNGLPLLPHVVTSISWVLPYTLSGPLQDSMRRTTNDSKDISLPSPFLFVIAINTLSIPIWGSQSTLQPPHHPPTPPTHTQQLWRMWPHSWPVSLPGTASLAPTLSSQPSGEHSGSRFFKLHLARAALGQRWQESVLSPGWSRPFVNRLGSFRYDRIKPRSNTDATHQFSGFILWGQTPESPKNKGLSLFQNCQSLGPICLVGW